MELTDKQKIFEDEHLINFNATRAYKAVYKNCKSDETEVVSGASSNVNLILIKIPHSLNSITCSINGGHFNIRGAYKTSE